MPNSFSSRPVRLALLVESRTGYQNLCRLMTRYKLREKEKGTGTATLEEVAEHAEGLVCLTGGEEGVLAASLIYKGYDEARKNVEKLTALFGAKNVYVEVQRHCDPAEERRNQAAVRLAETLGLPLLATNGVRYARAPEREILDVFTCIRNHSKLETAGRLLERNDERYLRSTEEMSNCFRICRRRFTTPVNSPQGSNTPWPISDTNFRAIRSRRRNNGFASPETH